MKSDPRHNLYYFGKERVPVKKDGQNLTVHCIFTKENKLEELILQSLRLFIERSLNGGKI